MVDGVNLFGEVLDLLDLIVNHLHKFRDFLGAIYDLLRMIGGVINGTLRLAVGRRVNP